MTIEQMFLMQTHEVHAIG
jgi:hypothetical protein